MTVDECSAKFDRLSRFALNLIPTKVDAAKKFKMGLRLKVQAKIVTQRVETMEEVLDRANPAENFWEKGKQKRNLLAAPENNEAFSKK